MRISGNGKYDILFDGSFYLIKEKKTGNILCSYKDLRSANWFLNTHELGV